MFKKIFPIAVFLLGGCDLNSMREGALDKSEYSVLQHYELKLRDANHEQSYMIVQRALDTELTVLAFPIKGKTTGYVVMLADGRGEPKVKVMPEVNFDVSKEAYSAVKAETTVSLEVDQFIAAQIR